MYRVRKMTGRHLPPQVCDRTVTCGIIYDGIIERLKYETGIMFRKMLIFGNGTVRRLYEPPGRTYSTYIRPPMI